MPTQLLSIGYVQTMLQDVVYALPSSRTRMFAEAGTYEQANDVAGPWTAITLVDGMVDLAGSHIRCTTAGPVDVKFAKF